MSIKTFTFRYDPDNDVGAWMAAQKNKKESVDLAIRLIIENMGDGDLISQIAKKVTLGDTKPSATKPQNTKPTNVRKKERDSAKKNEVEQEEHEIKQTSKDDTQTGLGFFSSL